MKPTPFTKNQPWRVMVPGSKSPTGKRRAYYFQTKEEALQFCREVKKGRLAPEPVAGEEADEFSTAVNRFAQLFDGDVAKLYEAAARIKTFHSLKPATVRQAIEEFQQIRASKVSAGTLDADRWRLLKLLRTFERQPIAEVTPADLRRFFDKLGARMNTRSVHKSVRTFFSWAKQYNYVAENPMLDIKPEGTFGVNNEIYTPASFERMLRVAAGLEAPKPTKQPTRDFIDLLPWFVLSGFCGLRSCEAFRLNRKAESIRWSDLYFERGFIEIRDEVAKATRRQSDNRHIERPHAVAAIQAWLALAPRRSELVCPWTKRQMQELKRRFTLATGIKFVENGLRNSFASYALTYTGLDGVGKLALEMGNSEAICRRHYIKTLEPRSGQAWFNLRPNRPANVIPMQAA